MKDSKLYLSAVRAKKEIELKLGNDIGWVGNILKSLNSDGNITKDTYLNINGLLKYHKSDALKEFVTFEGTISAKYTTIDVKTGDEIFDSFQAETAIIYLDESLNQSMGLEEETSYFVNDSEYELYVYDSFSFDLEEALNEQIQLNIDPYPCA